MIIPEIEQRAGVSLKRILCDAGYKGHNAPKEHRFKVYTAGQKRRMTEAIKREMRRRPAIEPVIGHAKSGHRCPAGQIQTFTYKDSLGRRINVW